MSHGNGQAHRNGRGANHFDIRAAAHRILTTAGFEADLPAPASQQLDTLRAPAAMPAGVRDMRDRPWSSIDNTESRDLDQIEIADALDNGVAELLRSGE